jgi:hypothetical protein
MILDGGKRHRVTYTDLLEPINEGRDQGDQISYSSLWVHAKRHYDIEGIAAYWEAWFYRELRTALGDGRNANPIE